MKYDPERCAQALKGMHGDESVYGLFYAAATGERELKRFLQNDLRSLCEITRFSIPETVVHGQLDEHGGRYIVQTNRKVGFLLLLRDMVDNGCVEREKVSGIMELLNVDSASYTVDDVNSIRQALRNLLKD